MSDLRDLADRFAEACATTDDVLRLVEMLGWRLEVAYGGAGRVGKAGTYEAYVLSTTAVEQLREAWSYPAIEIAPVCLFGRHRHFHIALALALVRGVYWRQRCAADVAAWRELGSVLR